MRKYFLWLILIVLSVNNLVVAQEKEYTRYPTTLWVSDDFMMNSTIHIIVPIINCKSNEDTLEVYFRDLSSLRFNECKLLSSKVFSDSIIKGIFEKQCFNWEGGYQLMISVNEFNSLKADSLYKYYFAKKGYTGIREAFDEKVKDDIPLSRDTYAALLVLFFNHYLFLGSDIDETIKIYKAKSDDELANSKSEK